ncbi:MAG: D-alanyl-D-alanine carboxypeptidase/D-alanyl-D-alanine-endopeptidase [Usitatibacteraceae bacterium]
MLRSFRSAGSALLQVLFLMLLSACAFAPIGTRTELPAKALSGLKTANIPIDAVGAIAIRLSDGAVLLSHRPDASMQPASTLKTVTSIVGLERLGPTYRGRSELRSKGEVVDGVLKGDLTLRGLGDPDLDWEALQRMLQTLRHKGVTQIDGNLILDRQWFQPPRPDLGAPPFDETPEFRYNVIPDALTLNMNLLQLDMESGEKIAGVRVNMMPKLDRVTVISNLTLIDRACADWEDGWKIPTVTRGRDGEIRVELHGEFPKKCATSTSVNVLDRVDFADRLFRTLWRNLGGTFGGQTRDASVADSSKGESRLLAQHQSRTLAEVTRDINKRSDNTITRMLYLSMGALAKTDSEGPTAARAERQVRAWFKAGYVRDMQNQLCVVVVMINHPLAKDGAARPVLDAVIDWVARSGKE